MKRGFKTKAEQSAIEARSALGLRAIEPLDPWAHAKRLNVDVMDFSTLELSARDIAQLTLMDADSWSGMTIKEGQATAIILNPSHPKTRQCSTLMHELAHLDLGHVPARVDVSPAGLLLLSEYDEAQEEEADWLAGTLLLPRQALMYFRRRGSNAREIAERFGVSEDMCVWRLRMTGVEAQLRHLGL